MATKRTPTKKTRPAKKATKKRASKAPAKKRASKAPAKKRTSKPPRKEGASRPPRGQGPAKKRTTAAPAKPSRPTKPAKRRAKKAGTAPVPASVSAPAPAPALPRIEAAVPPPRGDGPRRVASYLEGTPQDHAELVSGLLQVVRGAAKDLKTLVTQAIAMSNQKNDRFDR